MARRKMKTMTDFIVIALSPALIMGMVGCLLFFLLTVFYQGAYEARLTFIFAMFVMAIVLIARISMEGGSDYAALFALPLGLVALMAIIRFVRIDGFFAPVSIVINCALMGLIWWCAHKLTWDCTLIDDEQDASGEGLLQRIGLDNEQLVDDEQTTIDGDEEAEADSDLVRDGRQTILDFWKRFTERRRRPHTPGVWVIYFSLAALPLFGLGQWLISDMESRQYAFKLLFGYLGCGLGLLLTTSFLGLRRYLRQRDIDMPASMASVWLGVGSVVVVVFLAVCALLPRPNAAVAISQLPFRLTSPDHHRPSRHAFGQDGVEDEQMDGVSREDAQTKKSSDGSSSKSGGNKSGNQSKGKGGSQKGKGGQGSKGKKGEQSRGSKSGDSQSNNNSSQNQNQNSQGNQSNQNSDQSQSGNQSSDGQQQGDQNSSQGDQNSNSGNGNKSDSNNSQNGSDGQSQQNDGNQGDDSQDDGQQGGDGENSEDSDDTEQPNAGSPNFENNSRSAQSENQKRNDSRPSSGRRRSDSPPRSSSPVKAIGNGLLVIFKLIFYIVILCAAIYLAWRFRNELREGARKLWEDLKKLWERLMGGRERSRGNGVSAEPVAAQPTFRAFAEFPDPFETGLAQRATTGDLVKYSFEALEAWAREQGYPRGEEQTPNEFAQQISQHNDGIGSHAQKLAKLYGRLAYSQRDIEMQHQKPLRKLWKTMRREAVAAYG